jgi:hypothetical protein
MGENSHEVIRIDRLWIRRRYIFDKMLEVLIFINNGKLLPVWKKMHVLRIRDTGVVGLYL